MKKVKVTETKSLDIKVLRKELADLTMDKNMKKLKDVKVISKKKKEIAQFLTLVRQKEMLAQLESRVQKEDSSRSVIASKAKQSSTENNKIATSSEIKVGTPRNDKMKGTKK